MAQGNFPITLYDPQTSNAAAFGRGIDIGDKLVNSFYRPRTIEQNLLEQALRNKHQEMANANYPRESAQGMQAKDLENALKQIELQYAPRKTEADIGYKEAEIPNLMSQTAKNKAAIQNPLIDKTGVAGDIGAQIYLAQHPELNTLVNGNQPGVSPPQVDLPIPAGAKNIPGQLNQPLQMNKEEIDKINQLKQPESLASALKNSMNSKREGELARTDLAKKKAASLNFRLLKPDQANYAYAQTNTFGLDPTKAAQKFSEGKTLEDIAEEMHFGKDPSKWPDATKGYNMTAAQRNQLQKRNFAMNELDTLTEFTNKALGPYAATIGDYSLPQIAQMAKVKLGKGTDKDIDEMSDFLAAAIITPDLASVRANSVGTSNIGIGAIKHFEDTAFNKFKVLRSEFTPEVWTKANTRVTKVIKDAVNKATKLTLNPYPQIENNQPQNSAPEETIKVMWQGVEHEGPKSKIEGFLKKHPDARRI